MASILTYHKIGRQRELGITTVGRLRLASHLDYLAGIGRRLATASCAVAQAAAGSEEGAGDPAADDPPAAAPVAVTFDDGYESVYTDAFPELEARGIPATVFPVVGAVGGNNAWDVRLSLEPSRHLRWDQVEELARRGIEFGSHTLTHRDLTALPDADLREELAISRQILEDHIGSQVCAIAYPFGRYDRRVIDAALAAGYTLGFDSSPGNGCGCARGPLRGRSEPPLAGPGDLMAVGRMSVYCLDDRRCLARKLGCGHGHRLEVLKNRAIARLSRGTILVKRSGWGLP